MPKTSVFYTKPAYGHMGKMQIKNGDFASLCSRGHDSACRHVIFLGARLLLGK